MAGQLKLRRGTTSQLANYIGSEGELTYDTALKSLVLHDGVTLGGVKIPYLSNNLVPSTMLPTSTELVIGASKIATTAIARAGVNDTDFLTAKKLRDALNATGEAPVYACRAWVNFKGIDTVAINASGNVLSITDNGVGDYTVNFDKPMPHTNYCLAGAASQSTGSGATAANVVAEAKSSGSSLTLKTVNAVRIITVDNSGDTLYDSFSANVAIFC